MKKATLVFIALLACGINAQSQEISEKNIRQTIGYLASDKLQGRATSSPGERLAAEYIANLFKEYKLVPKGDSAGSYYFHFKCRYNPDKTDTVPDHATERNGTDVIGYLDNGAQYTIVIGAHLDHLGLGYDGNSLDPNPKGKIHPGADDNASGVAGVLELARYYSSQNKKGNYNFLFTCFSGEELGLFGSKKYCEKPTIDLSKVDLMINMDMIGRLNDSTKRLIVYGVGTAPGLVRLIDSVPSAFSIKKDSAGIGPSDQTSFYLKNIPVLFFFTGEHSDYHKPSDVAAKINYPGEKHVLDYIIRVVAAINAEPKLVFTPTRNTEIGRKAAKYKVTMGVMPDYSFDGEGMKIDGVTDGKPASKAGIKQGDIVIQMGDLKIKSMMDYMKALSAFKKDETTDVVLMRNGKKITVKVTF